MRNARIAAALLLSLGCASSSEGLLGPDAVELDGLSYSLRVERAAPDSAALLVEMTIHNPGLRRRTIEVNGWIPVYVRIHRASDDSLVAMSPEGGPRPLGALVVPSFGARRVSHTIPASTLERLPAGVYRLRAVLSSDPESTLDRTISLPLGDLR